MAVRMYGVPSLFVLFNSTPVQPLLIRTVALTASSHTRPSLQATLMLHESEVGAYGPAVPRGWFASPS